MIPVHPFNQLQAAFYPGPAPSAPRPGPAPSTSRSGQRPYDDVSVISCRHAELIRRLRRAHHGLRFRGYSPVTIVPEAVCARLVVVEITRDDYEVFFGLDISQLMTFRRWYSRLPVIFLASEEDTDLAKDVIGRWWGFPEGFILVHSVVVLTHIMSNIINQ